MTSDSPNRAETSHAEYISFTEPFSVRVAQSNLVLLASPDRQVVLEGDLYVDLAREFEQGVLQIDECLDHLAPRYEPVAVYAALEMLAARKLIEITADPNARYAATVMCFGQLSDSLVLQDLNLPDVSKPTIIALTDDYLDPELWKSVRETQKDHQILLAKPNGRVLWFGPLMYGNSPCPDCITKRLAQQRPDISRLEENISQLVSPLSLNVNLAMLTALSAGYFRNSQSLEQLRGRILTYDTLKQKLRSHVVFPLHNCHRCNSSVPSNDGQWSRELTDVQKLPVQHLSRTCSPSQTVDRLRRHISPVVGLIRSAKVDEIIPGLYRGSAVGSHLHNEFHSVEELREGGLRGGSGKGRTPEEAMAGAMCECLEMYCARYSGDEPTIWMPYSALAGEAIRLNDCLLVSAQQFDRARYFSPWTSSRCWIPNALPDNTCIDWTRVWSLTNERYRYLPTSYCYINYRSDDALIYCQADTNGNASGNCIEEAILHGLYELIERDAAAIFWYNKVGRAGVSFDGVSDPLVSLVKTYYASIGRQLWTLDITSDLGVPAFVSVSHRNNLAKDRIILGFGAHLNPQIAMSRCLTENVQCLGVPESFGLPEHLEQWFEQSVESYPQLLANDNIATNSVASIPDRSCPSLKAEIHTCVELLRRQDLEVLVLDLTRSDTPLSVVRVVVPGLRPPGPRFAPGRLYTVPVAMGWAPFPKHEDDLQQFPLPM